MMAVEVARNPRISDWSGIEALLRAEFAFMGPRIDPPSSLTRMNAADLAAKAQTEDLFLIGSPTRPTACLFGAAAADHYYIGKLAVAASHRGTGLARRLIDAAAIQARATSAPCLRLHTRVELTENHAAFAAIGFHQTGTFTHPGFNRPTSLVFERPV